MGDFVIPSSPPKACDPVEVVRKSAPLASRSTTDEPTNAGTSGDSRDSNPTECSSTDPLIEATCHDGRLKSKWSISPRPSTRVLVLGDSNMKLATTRLNSEYEIHAFSGAYISHMYTILAQSELDPPHFGCCHCSRDQSQGLPLQVRNATGPMDTSRTRRQVAGTREGALPGECQHRKKPTRTSGISTRRRAQKFGVRYIPPLPVDQVSIRSDDNSGIHHDSGTVQRILQSIKTHLDQPKFLN